ncbi:ATP-binding protein [Vibrio splendidus]|uniref:ATP-binding protein n=1 Tax=Vibrio splendidus TaxID=29497 RepID=UPI0006CA0C10|nr:ATP-binding protein [Vibrio splendidus]
MCRKKSNFLAKIKNILAGRAGYQCCHPNCNVITIGPGESPDTTSSIGEAAHIFSASLNGPRGQGGLSNDELRSVDNGFWACKNHARLIDTNSGEGFTAEQLKAWRALHETKIKLLQGRIQRPLFWLHSLKINKMDLFADEQKIYFGKVTFIYGSKNASGKSTLLDLVNSISSFNRLENRVSNDEYFNYELELFNPDLNKLEITSKNNQILSRLNNNNVHFNPMPIAIFRYDLKFIQGFHQDNRDDLDKFIEYLSVDKLKLENILSALGKSQYSTISSAYFEYQTADEEDEDFLDGYYLRVVLKSHGRPLNFSSLSGGQKSMVLLELISELVQVHAKYKQSILLFNLQATSFHDDTLANYLKFFMSSDIDYQTVITSVRAPKCEEVKLLNYYSLLGALEGVEIQPVKH